MKNDFNVKKAKEEIEKEYAELLKDANLKKGKKNEFVLGKKKDIYEDNLSLDDILGANGFVDDKK
jgi:hypothetical protein